MHYVLIQRKKMYKNIWNICDFSRNISNKKCFLKHHDFRLDSTNLGLSLST